MSFCTLRWVLNCAWSSPSFSQEAQVSNHRVAIAEQLGSGFVCTLRTPVSRKKKFGGLLEVAFVVQGRPDLLQHITELKVRNAAQGRPRSRCA